MNLKEIIDNSEKYIHILQDLKSLFHEMDSAYQAVSARYGFACNGCEENCCRSLFHHHTLLEVLYLNAGFQTIDTALQQDIRKNAAEYNVKTAAGVMKMFCPLNFESRCILYPYRPMICRLHGISHELKRFGERKIISPGCSRFMDLSAEIEYIPFDRTPWYTNMSKLEQAVRQLSGYRPKIKMTVAEILSII